MTPRQQDTRAGRGERMTATMDVYTSATTTATSDTQPIQDLRDEWLAAAADRSPGLS